VAHILQKVSDTGERISEKRDKLLQQNFIETPINKPEEIKSGPQAVSENIKLSENPTGQVSASVNSAEQFTKPDFAGSNIKIEPLEIAENV